MSRYEGRRVSRGNRTGPCKIGGVMSRIEQELRREIEPVIDGLGFYLVELKASELKDRFHAVVTIYREAGVDLDACAEIHRTILPRIELWRDARDVHLQVSSPGLDRTLKHQREYAIFAGKRIRVLLSSSKEWVSGVLRGSDEDSCTIETADGIRRVAFAEIRKAKLDDFWEER